MNPSPTELQKHLQTHYPGGTYHSVYEAGYSGFWIHRKLNALGIHNIVINPADVPTTDKERRHKNDSWDAQKLSRELNNDSLKAIYVPNEFHESIRALSRLRERVVSHQTRLKNRIKAFLSINGINLPPNSECQHWSKRFMTMLESLELHTPAAKEALAFSLEELQQTRQRLVTLTRRLRHHIQNHDDNWIVEQLLKVPGVGFITASTFYTEVMDINRFRNNDALNSFTGLAPSTHSSGDTDKDTGITPRRNRRLRHMMIEAAWTAVRKDPALLLYFNNLLLRMPKQKAIVRVAKKLTNRMRHVWRTKQPYVTCVVE
jgi:transposase